MTHRVRRTDLGIAGLVSAVQELSVARDLTTVRRLAARFARRIVRCEGAAFVAPDGDMCAHVAEDAVAPVLGAMRLHMDECASGWCFVHRTPLVLEDIYLDPRVPHERYRRTFVRSLAMVPVRPERPLGVIATYWAGRHHATAEEVELLQALADATAVSLEHVALVERLERQLESRTEELRQLSLTDELTGLANRRGFLLRAEQARAMITRRGETGLLLFADVDDLKRINDEHGHEAGDRTLRTAAAVLADAVREMDVVGRWGGDEFVAFLPSTWDAEAIRGRVAARLATSGDGSLSMSIGAYRVASTDTRPLEQLIAEADQAMLSEKRRRKGAGRIEVPSGATESRPRAPRSP